MGQVTVFSGPERRRRWSEEERLRILSEAFAPGACVAEVCRRHDISSALIYTWRRKLLDAEAARDGDAPEALPTPVFAEAVLDEDAVAVNCALSARTALRTVFRASPVSRAIALIGLPRS